VNSSSLSYQYIFHTKNRCFDDLIAGSEVETNETSPTWTIGMARIKRDATLIEELLRWLIAKPI
jgi:hypothetical protein